MTSTEQERVAREVADKCTASILQLLREYQSYKPGPLGPFLPALSGEVYGRVAAALAACARERDRLNREYYKDVLNKAKLSAAAWKIHETPILSEAERAAGERAGDLRVKS